MKTKKRYFMEKIKTRSTHWWVWEEKRGAYYFFCECDTKEAARKICRIMNEVKR